MRKNAANLCVETQVFACKRVQLQEIRLLMLSCLRIPADADQHSWVIAITIPA